jgi:hypothetical protein
MCAEFARAEETHAPQKEGKGFKREKEKGKE